MKHRYEVYEYNYDGLPIKSEDKIYELDTDENVPGQGLVASNNNALLMSFIKRFFNTMTSTSGFSISSGCAGANEIIISWRKPIWKLVKV